MAVIVAAGRRFEVDAVVFDKDGTLVDFDRLWGPRTVRWVESLANLTGRPQLAAALYRALGYDSHSAAFVPDGPLAIATTNDVYALAAGVLFQHGFGWHESWPLVTRAAANTLAAPPDAAEIRPRGDVAGTLRRLRAAGVLVGVATNDERAFTKAMLVQMGVAGEVSSMVCADDGLPPKPDPAGLRRLASELGTIPARLAMIGDSANDMLFGRNAGVAACIGVSGGAGDAQSLERFADVVVAGVEEIRLGNQSSREDRYSSSGSSSSST